MWHSPHCESQVHEKDDFDVESELWLRPLPTLAGTPAASRALLDLTEAHVAEWKQIPCMFQNLKLEEQDLDAAANFISFKILVSLKVWAL